MEVIISAGSHRRLVPDLAIVVNGTNNRCWFMSLTKSWHILGRCGRGRYCLIIWRRIFDALPQLSLPVGLTEGCHGRLLSDKGRSAFVIIWKHLTVVGVFSVMMMIEFANK